MSAGSFAAVEKGIQDQCRQIGEDSEGVFESTISGLPRNTTTESLKKLGRGGGADAQTLEDAGGKIGAPGLPIAVRHRLCG